MVKETKLYDLLGVSPTANDNDLKKGYKKAALKYHPDKPTGDTEKFKEISEAFDILSNADKRKIYDNYGLEAARRGGFVPEPPTEGGHSGTTNGGFPPGAFPGFGGGASGAGGPGGPFMFSSNGPGGGTQTFSFSTGGPGGGGGYTPFSSNDAFNIFRNFSDSGGFEGEDDIFSMLGGGGGGGRGGRNPFAGMSSKQGFGSSSSRATTSPERKHDPLTIDLPVTLEDLAKGTTKKMKIKRRNIGKLEENILNVDIKPGWKAGTKLTFPKSGEVFADGSTQDVIFVIQEKPHSTFKRVDNDLEISLDLSLKEALCGFSKIVETIDGKRIKVENRRPISPGHLIRYPGRGMPISKSPGSHGDLLIKIHVKFPSELTQEQRNAIEQNF